MFKTSGFLRNHWIGKSLCLYLGNASSLDVNIKLPPGFVTPPVRDPIVSPLCSCMNSSARLAEMTGSSIITTKFIFLRVSLITGLVITKVNFCS